MKSLSRAPLNLIGALLLVTGGLAYGAQPPDLVKSDSDDNTAMGTNALLSLNSSVCCNTAAGQNALKANTTGTQNTASGDSALSSTTTGAGNAAFGGSALFSNVGGDFNTASGYEALYFNTSGAGNTASGVQALYNNVSGDNNTASGASALFSNTTGNYNAAIGASALLFNNTGSDNTASGVDALYSNTTADYNTASGYGALYSSNANSNTASGYQAMYADTSGMNNTATGVHALASNTTGSNNIAEGWHGGYNLTTGSNNIDIGSVGAAGDANSIKIGTSGTQTATFIAGIYNETVSGNTVVVNSKGQLGVAAISSERFKTAIAPMGSNIAKLVQLRPVTFHYKTSPHGALQYGLIAEEVAKVYPDLVIRSESGRIDGVRYDELAPLLLNEVQQQFAQIRELKAEQVRMQQQVADLKALDQATQIALRKLQTKDEIVAQR